MENSDKKPKFKAKIQQTKCKIGEKLNKIKQFIVQNNVELLIFLGLFFIILASFLLNIIAGFYILGISFIGFAVFLLKFPSGRGGE